MDGFSCTIALLMCIECCLFSYICFIKAKNEESDLRLAKIKKEEYEFERDIVTYHTCHDTIFLILHLLSVHTYGKLQLLCDCCTVL